MCILILKFIIPRNKHSHFNAFSFRISEKRQIYANLQEISIIEILLLFKNKYGTGKYI